MLLLIYIAVILGIFIGFVYVMTITFLSVFGECLKRYLPEVYDMLEDLKGFISSKFTKN